MEKHVLLKKLRDALESLKGRVTGRNMDDVEEAIAMVSLFFKMKDMYLVCIYTNKQIFLLIPICVERII